VFSAIIVGAATSFLSMLASAVFSLLLGELNEEEKKP
jgi:hypothetical protein